MWQRRLDLGVKGADPIPAVWEETIAACLAKDPKDRPQTVRELKARRPADRRPPNAALGRCASGRWRGGDFPPGRQRLFPIEDDSFEETSRGTVTPLLKLQAPPTKDESLLRNLPCGRSGRRTLSRRTTLTSARRFKIGRKAPSNGAVTCPLPEAFRSHSGEARCGEGVPMWAWLGFTAVILLGPLVYIIFRPMESIAPAPVRVASAEHASPNRNRRDTNPDSNRPDAASRAGPRGIADATPHRQSPRHQPRFQLPRRRLPRRFRLRRRPRRCCRRISR